MITQKSWFNTLWSVHNAAVAIAHLQGSKHVAFSPWQLVKKRKKKLHPGWSENTDVSLLRRWPLSFGIHFLILVALWKSTSLYSYLVNEFAVWISWTSGSNWDISLWYFFKELMVMSADVNRKLRLWTSDDYTHICARCVRTLSDIMHSPVPYLNHHS